MVHHFNKSTELTVISYENYTNKNIFYVTYKNLKVTHIFIDLEEENWATTTFSNVSRLQNKLFRKRNVHFFYLSNIINEPKLFAGAHCAKACRRNRNFEVQPKWNSVGSRSEYDFNIV